MKTLIASISVIAVGSFALLAHAKTAQEIIAYCQEAKNTPSSGEGGEYPGMPHTAWRCMSGHVYVCNMGATGYGCAHMDTSPQLKAHITAFCRSNPDSQFVPMSVAGTSPTSWRCDGMRPVAGTSEPVDKQGYLKRTWRRVD
jgi:hypothetical protein